MIQAGMKKRGILTEMKELVRKIFGFRKICENGEVKTWAKL